MPLTTKSAFLSTSIFYMHATDHQVSLSVHIYLLHACHWPPSQPFCSHQFTTCMPLTTKSAFLSTSVYHMHATDHQVSLSVHIYLPNAWHCQVSCAIHIYLLHMKLTLTSAFLSNSSLPPYETILSLDLNEYMGHMIVINNAFDGTSLIGQACTALFIQTIAFP